jgi:hypothetical protein
MRLHPHLKKETDPVTEALRSLVFRIPYDGQNPKSLILRKSTVITTNETNLHGDPSHDGEKEETIPLH